MDPLPDYEIIAGCEIDDHEETERLLDRLRRNDPTLKQLTLAGRTQFYEPQYHEQTILQVLDAIATNSSLKALTLYSSAFLHRLEITRRLMIALITNTSLKHLHLHLFRNTMPGWVTKVLNIVRASPNLEALTLQDGIRLSGIEDIAALAQGLCVHTNLHSLTIEGFLMHSDCAAAFTAAFQANQTIKTLIMGWRAIEQDAGVSFVEALPHDHSLETIIFEGNRFNDDGAVGIVIVVKRE